MVSSNVFRQGQETPGGPLPFTPAPRCRSESSFSDFRYDNEHCPPAGVSSARLKHHFSRSCGAKAGGVIGDVLVMGERQALSATKERLDGPRRDPASLHAAAGSRSEQLTLLLNHEAGGDVQVGEKPKRAQGFILDVQRKAKASCTPTGQINPLNPELHRQRYHRRLGYKHIGGKQTWTWNECQEVDHTPNASRMNMRRAADGKSGDPGCIKVHTSVKGEKKYNVCGVEDMLPAATCKFIKSDAPPTARHVYENDRRELQGFERGTPRTATRMYSDDTWYCLTNNPRPDHRHVYGSCSDTNLRAMVEQVYSGRMTPRSPGVMSARSPRYAESLASTEDGSTLLYRRDNGKQSQTPHRPALQSPGSQTSFVSRASSTPSKTWPSKPKWK